MKNFEKCLVENWFGGKFWFENWLVENWSKWVKNKKCGTNLERDSRNNRLFELISRAENWLKNSTYNNLILKWETKAWGEIPADFGRK